MPNVFTMKSNAALYSDQIILRFREGWSFYKHVVYFIQILSGSKDISFSIEFRNAHGTVERTIKNVLYT